MCMHICLNTYIYKVREVYITLSVPPNTYTIEYSDYVTINILYFAISIRFTAMRELVSACDRLMEDLKGRVHRLKGVYERSDAMLANYAGGTYGE